MRTTFLLFIFTIFFLSNNALSQKEIEHTIESEYFEEDRTIKVLLPARYERDTINDFIVTYVLDAQYDQFWNQAKSNIDYMVDSYSVIPMIAVGVVSEDRGSDFSPSSKDLVQHIQKEIMPLIQENYRVNDFSIVVTHSWGGAFTFSTLFSEYKDVFDAYLAISPSIGYNDRQLLHEADSILKSGTVFNTCVFATTGDVGRREHNFIEEVNALDSMIKSHPENKIVFQQEVIEGTDHWSCVIPSLSLGLPSLCRNYWADQKIMEDMVGNLDCDFSQGIVNYTDEAQAKYGYSHECSAGYIRFAADDFFEEELYSEALDLHEWAADQKPNDIQFQYRVARDYQHLNQAEDAISQFELCLQMAEDQKDDLSESEYNDYIEYFTEQLEKLRE